MESILGQNGREEKPRHASRDPGSKRQNLVLFLFIFPLIDSDSPRLFPCFPSSSPHQSHTSQTRITNDIMNYSLILNSLGFHPFIHFLKPMCQLLGFGGEMKGFNIYRLTFRSKLPFGHPRQLQPVQVCDIPFTAISKSSLLLNLSPNPKALLVL